MRSATDPGAREQRADVQGQHDDACASGANMRASAASGASLLRTLGFRGARVLWQAFAAAGRPCPRVRARVCVCVCVCAGCTYGRAIVRSVSVGVRRIELKSWRFVSQPWLSSKPSVVIGKLEASSGDAERVASPAAPWCAASKLHDWPLERRQ